VDREPRWKVHQVTQLLPPNWTVHDPWGNWSGKFSTWDEAIAHVVNVGGLMAKIEDWLRKTTPH
jgi:hypothetical protein